MAARLCPTLVARDDERAALERALDGLADGAGALVAILGEAGIGKTRLTTELATAATERGLPVLVGRAVDAGTPVPYRPLFEALSAWSRRGGTVAPELASLQALLAPIVPGWRSGDEPSFVPSSVELGDALLRLLVGVGDGRGCVLVLEDLHWADPETLAVVEYLGDGAADAGVLVVVSTRPEGRDALRVVRALASRRAATTLELRRLQHPELAEMAQACLAAAALPADIDALVQRFSDGLPFLVEELLAASIDNGALVDGPEGWRLDAGAAPILPEGFEELVRRRLERLVGAEIGVLQVAAVLGPRFDVEVLTRLAEQPAEVVVGAMRHGVEAQLLVADPTDPRSFTFRHALTRDALLAQLLPFERLELARRVLEALEADDPGLPGDRCELAAALAEQVGDGERAARHLLTAARRSIERGALSSAEPVLDRAWRLARRDDAVWPEVGLALIGVLTEVGDVDRALEVGGRLLADLPGDVDRSGTHLAMARAATTSGRWEAATRSLAQVGDALAVRADPQVRATFELESAEVALAQHRYDEALALAESGLAGAEAVGDHAAVCQALLLIGRHARYRSMDVHLIEGAFDRVIAVGRDEGLPTWRLRGLMERASLDLWGFRPGVRLEAARVEAADAGALVVAAHLDNFAAWLAVDHHDPDRAERAAEQCIELTQRLRLPTLEGMARGAAAVAAGQRGDRALMDLRIDGARSVAADHPDVQVAVQDARVALAVRLDDLDQLSAELDAVMVLLEVAPLPLPARGLHALVRMVRDDGGDAALDALVQQPSVIHARTAAFERYARAVALGRTGDADAATRLVAEGDAVRLPLAWFQHHARRLVAEAAVADGWGTPVQWLQEALEVFEPRGESELAASSRRLLAQAGAPVPTPARRVAAADGVPEDLAARGVTARELEVLELLARATATKDIAAQLYLSPKTVERHVSNLASKLDVPGRAGLVAFAAARLGPAR